MRRTNNLMTKFLTKFEILRGFSFVDVVLFQIVYQICEIYRCISSYHTHTCSYGGGLPPQPTSNFGQLSKPTHLQQLAMNNFKNISITLYKKINLWCSVQPRGLVIPLWNCLGPLRTYDMCIFWRTSHAQIILPILITQPSSTQLKQFFMPPPPSLL